MHVSSNTNNGTNAGTFYLNANRNIGAQFAEIYLNKIDEYKPPHISKSFKETLMKSYSKEQPEVYDVSGTELRINFNMNQIEVNGLEEPEIVWEFDQVLCNHKDNRSSIIEKIIASKYTVGAELATINNQANDPDAYAAYQAFRVLAKELADGYVA